MIMGRDSRVVYRLVQHIWLHVNKHITTTIHIDWKQVGHFLALLFLISYISLFC
jgi:hypothetical protein